MRTHQLWLDELDPEELRALDQGDPQQSDPHPDVLVVGGGILGVATAMALRSAGLDKVVLTEADSLGVGPSGSAAGLLIPEAHYGEDGYSDVDLGRRGLRIWRDLQEQHPGIGLTDLDVLSLEPIAERFKDIEPPAGAVTLDEHEVASLFPELTYRGAGTMFRNQARINPLRALIVLAESAGTICTHAPVTSIRVSSNRVVSVTTPKQTFEPGSVIFCTGGPPSVEGLRSNIPSDSVRGHMYATDPGSGHLPAMLLDPSCAPLPDGRLLVGGTLDIGESSREVNEDIVEQMRREVAQALPQTGRLAISHAWVCFRPHHPDYLPVTDRFGDLENAWFTSGHYRTGILVAPAVGRDLADWVTAGKPPKGIEEFSAARFANRQSGE